MIHLPFSQRRDAALTPELSQRLGCCKTPESGKQWKDHRKCTKKSRRIGERETSFIRGQVTIQKPGTRAVMSKEEILL
ncbi:hypothetical protein Mapa_010144 [Marchantia paleacea]|nr:hypothetical protein Mapa_010144 [Marchantia paleacea]